MATTKQPHVWRNKESTAAWVQAQAHAQESKTRRWVYEQQIRVDGYRTLHDDDVHRRKEREEMMYAYKIEAQSWLKHEEEMRRLIMQMELEKARRAKQEQRQREAETAERASRRRRPTQTSTQAKGGSPPLPTGPRVVAGKTRFSVRNLWTRREQQWSAFVASTGPIKFQDIPWPLPYKPVTPEMISSVDIQSFVLSKEHAEAPSPKERIRGAQLRWHPDRFSRLMSRVVEKDRQAVREGVNIVAQAMNEAMRRVRVRKLLDITEGCMLMMFIVKLILLGRRDKLSWHPPTMAHGYNHAGVANFIMILKLGLAFNGGVNFRTLT